MKDNEKAFYLFYDWIDDLDNLDGTDAWQVVKAISEYHRHGTNPLDSVDGTLRVVVSIMLHQIKRGEEISEVRRKAVNTRYNKPDNFVVQNPTKYNKEVQPPTTDNSIQNTDNNYSLKGESNTRVRTREGTPSPGKKAYGEFKNVYLTDNELEELKKQFGDRADELIENFSQKLKSKGYKYDDHYVTIRLWEIQDASESANKRADETACSLPSVVKSSPEKGKEMDEWFEAKLERTFKNETGGINNGKH